MKFHRFKDILPSILLSLNAQGCIENPTLIREHETTRSQTIADQTHNSCLELQSGQYSIDNIAEMIFMDVQSTTTHRQRGTICLQDSQPNQDYLSNGEITFFKKSNRHQFIITPSQDHNAYEICDGEIAISPQNTSIYPASQTSSDQGYTRYGQLKSEGIGILEADPNTICGLKHVANVQPCHATNVLVEQSSDQSGTSWCLTVGSFLE